ncbi:MAG: tRNA (guanosine(37)-N1)-methyltransferase TrmD [Lachnospiraceae bacterium]|nr:tRNA (guanosine(37)-N1)-methyltransferase TrmD [Lachnospiraceae bacterium]
MKFVVLTLFPDMIKQAVAHSVLGRAIEKGLITVEAVDIRDYAHNKHNTVDDYPFGGGAGMVMQAPPVWEACEDVKRRFVSPAAPVIFMSPAGKTLTQQRVRKLAENEEIILLCGHYEGIDQRVLDEIVTDEISIGDYVLTGGELPALVVMDAVARMVDGVLGNEASAQEESFSGMWLEYPQYTRPREFHGKEVPEVLLSGHHANIEKWRMERAIETTLDKRPDMICEEKMGPQEKKIYKQVLAKRSLQKDEPVV